MTNNNKKKKEKLINAMGFAHWALDVEWAHVLPVLFQQRHQKVDRQTYVGRNFFEWHVHISDGNRQTQHLLLWLIWIKINLNLW